MPYFKGKYVERCPIGFEPDRRGVCVLNKKYFISTGGYVGEDGEIYFPPDPKPDPKPKPTPPDPQPQPPDPEPEPKKKIKVKGDDIPLVDVLIPVGITSGLLAGVIYNKYRKVTNKRVRRELEMTEINKVNKLKVEEDQPLIDSEAVQKRTEGLRNRFRGDKFDVTKQDEYTAIDINMSDEELEPLINQQPVDDITEEEFLNAEKSGLLDSKYYYEWLNTKFKNLYNRVFKGDVKDPSELEPLLESMEQGDLELINTRFPNEAPDAMERTTLLDDNRGAFGGNIQDEEVFEDIPLNEAPRDPFSPGLRQRRGTPAEDTTEPMIQEPIIQEQTQEVEPQTLEEMRNDYEQRRQQIERERQIRGGDPTPETEQELIDKFDLDEFEYQSARIQAGEKVLPKPEMEVEDVFAGESSIITDEQINIVKGGGNFDYSSIEAPSIKLPETGMIGVADDIAMREAIAVASRVGGGVADMAGGALVDGIAREIQGEDSALARGELIGGGATTAAAVGTVGLIGGAAAAGETLGVSLVAGTAIYAASELADLGWELILSTGSEQRDKKYYDNKVKQKGTHYLDAREAEYIRYSMAENKNKYHNEWSDSQNNDEALAKSKQYEHYEKLIKHAKKRNLPVIVITNDKGEVVNFVQKLSEDDAEAYIKANPTWRTDGAIDDDMAELLGLYNTNQKGDYGVEDYELYHRGDRRTNKIEHMSKQDTLIEINYIKGDLERLKDTNDVNKKLELMNNLATLDNAYKNDIPINKYQDGVKVTYIKPLDRDEIKEEHQKILDNPRDYTSKSDQWFEARGMSPDLNDINKQNDVIRQFNIYDELNKPIEAVEEKTDAEEIAEQLKEIESEQKVFEMSEVEKDKMERRERQQVEQQVEEQVETQVETPTETPTENEVEQTE